MKKYCILLCCLLSTIIIHGQIKLSSQAEKQPEKIAFDNSRNWQGEHYRNYIGQTLYVVPKPEQLVKYGYEGFYETPNGNIYQQVSKISRNTKTEALASKTFKVEDAKVIGKNILGYPNVFLKLTSNSDTLYYNYDIRYEHTFPFIVMAYLDKLKADYIGKKSCLRKCPDTKLPDYVNGKDVMLTPGSLWTCSDIVLDTKYYTLTMLFTNDKGETISNEANRYKFMFISEPYKQKLEAKYGKAIVLTAIKGNIQKGMSGELVKVAYGEPIRINDASYGEQWVYDGYYVYFRNGKVTGWN